MKTEIPTRSLSRLQILWNVAQNTYSVARHSIGNMSKRSLMASHGLYMTTYTDDIQQILMVTSFYKIMDIHCAYILN